MKLFEALFDITLLPVAIAMDIVLFPVKAMNPDEPSETRKQVEKIDKDLNE